MNKTIVTLLISILIVTSAHAYEDVITDGAIGAIVGAVIGNNMGSGDSETGAVIGGISAIIFGEKGRSHRVKGRSHHVKKGCHTHTHTTCTCKVILHPVTKTIEIRERVWVPGRVIRNACGEVIYREAGRYETHSRFETITVYR